MRNIFLRFIRFKLVSGFFSLILIGLVMTALYKLNYFGQEGFSPTDDGVILAQSFRILQGQIPHLDFIALKPCLSGYIHTIHFYAGLPLMDSCRLFVFFQYCCISFLWTRFFLKTLAVQYHLWQFYIIAFTVTFLNINHSFLFPWTTTDALWLVSFCLIFIEKAKQKNTNTSALPYWLVSIFILSLSALCRQSFIFLPILLFIYLVWKNAFRFNQLAFLFFAAAFPFLIYAAYLFKHHAFHAFFYQIVGRTEFFDTGVLRLVKSFLKDKLILFYFLSIVFYIFTRLKGKLFHRYARLISLFYLLVSVGYAFIFSLQNDPMLMVYPWALFCLICNTLLVNQLSDNKIKDIFPLIVILVTAWVVSISMGVNSPVYLVGVLFIACLLTTIFTVKGNFEFKTIKNQYKTIFISVCCLLVVCSFIGQKRYNYQDRPSRELKYALAKLIPEFGQTVTNENTFHYYEDLLETMKTIPNDASVVFLPNNAALYPLLNRPNPFPVDWMQHDEYIGSEELLFKKMEDAFQRKKIYLIIDYFKSKQLAKGLSEFNFKKADQDPNDLFIKKYKVDKYGYWRFVQSITTEVESQSRYFKVRMN